MIETSPALDVVLKIKSSASLALYARAITGDLVEPAHLRSQKVEVEQDFDKPAQEFNITADSSTDTLRASQLIKDSQL
ncbi:hypothetical protein [Chamaesiphon minutus]|uniref:Uncharacterized protein n=1 Tax=Chamaesiphon minutus (strain ATCC 27169 / PCC 6605) TaxID=1173020 RepID=K9URC9_CHAP6|nr:hypothetical protein [Chamaesiphon minutus]AFY97021.1 hypothetical protein Cha6605_6191 [Chamaesiphon minutus PCC 6605]